MRFAGWYLKIAAVGASIGAAMELFMIHTGFCTLLAPLTPSLPRIQPFPLVVSLKFLVHYQAFMNELSTVDPAPAPNFGFWWLIGRSKDFHSKCSFATLQILPSFEFRFHPNSDWQMVYHVTNRLV
jgi:hypothetical protein